MNWAVTLLLILAVVFGGLYALGILGYILILGGVLLGSYLFYKVFVRKFGPYESALIYRFGRYHRTSPAGWTMIIPGMEKIGAVVDLREQKARIEVPAITKEGLRVNLSALIYFFVENPENVILNVQDYRSSMQDLIESRVRDISAEFNFTELFINIEDVSEILHNNISQALGRWGLNVSMLELERIEPPKDLMDALEEKSVSQEVLEAKKFAAEARRILVDALGEGTKNFDDKTISYLYIKALENMKSSKMMIPTEFLNVVKNGSGGSALAKGMIAGTTFNKALTAIGGEAIKNAKMNSVELEDKLHGIKDETSAQETTREIDEPKDLDTEFDDMSQEGLEDGVIAGDTQLDQSDNTHSQ